MLQQQQDTTTGVTPGRKCVLLDLHAVFRKSGNVIQEPRVLASLGGWGNNRRSGNSCRIFWWQKSGGAGQRLPPSDLAGALHESTVCFTAWQLIVYKSSFTFYMKKNDLYLAKMYVRNGGEGQGWEEKQSMYTKFPSCLSWTW